MESSSSDEECNAILYSNEIAIEGESVEEASENTHSFLEQLQCKELNDKAANNESDISNINTSFENVSSCNVELLPKEENSENNDIFPEKINEFTVKSDENQSDIIINKSMGDASSSNVKFLSSEFFDQFICQPGTSKDNPEIISGSENKIETDGSTTEKQDLGADIGNISSDCKLRKNIDKKEEKNNDFNDSHVNSQTQNIPFSGFGNYVTPFSFIQPEKKTYNTSEEYFSDLRLWLQQAFFWQSVTASFPYFLMCQQLGQTASNNQPPGLNFPPQFPFSFPQFQSLGQPTTMPPSSSVPNHQASQRQPVTDGV